MSQVYLKFLRPKKPSETEETGNIPVSWDTSFPYLYSGKVTPPQTDNSTPLSDCFGICKGVGDDMQPYASGDEIRVKPGMAEIYGRQAKWDDSAALGKGSDFPNGGYIAVYIVVDLTDPIIQKAYFYLSQSTSLSKRDDLYKSESGLARMKIACFRYDPAKSVLTYLDPSLGTESYAVQMPYLKPQTTDKAENIKYTADSKPLTSLLDGKAMKWADTSATGETDSRFLSGTEGFSAGRGLYRLLANGDIFDGSSIHSGATADTYSIKASPNPYQTFDDSRLLGFRISLAPKIASGLSYGIRLQFHTLSGTTNYTNAEIFISSFDRTVWLHEDRHQTLYLNFYLATGVKWDGSDANIKYANISTMEANNCCILPTYNTRKERYYFDLLTPQETYHKDSYSDDLLYYRDHMSLGASTKHSAFKLGSTYIIYDSDSSTWSLGSITTFVKCSKDTSVPISGDHYVKAWAEMKAGHMENGLFTETTPSDARLLISPIYRTT